jgi:hypothetical protein
VIEHLSIISEEFNMDAEATTPKTPKTRLTNSTNPETGHVQPQIDRVRYVAAKQLENWMIPKEFTIYQS